MVPSPHAERSENFGIAPPLLSVENLIRHFRTRRTGWFGAHQTVNAVDGVSFAISKGEVFGIVGESGCGKSSVAKAILNIHPPQADSVRLNGTELTTLTLGQWRNVRLKIQYVFQDPMDSLDPRIRVLHQVVEPLTIHGVGTAPGRRDKAIKLLKSVGLRDGLLNKFPHELSGGQRQRVVLARALVLEPDLVLCDEPISALDVSIQAQIIRLLQKLRVEFGLTILFISHDLNVVRLLCDRVAVMYLGKIVELGKTRDVFHAPKHPYTQALISAIPVAMPGIRRETDPP